MEENKKKLVQQILSGGFALFFLAFGTTWNKKFCLGDVIMSAVGLPAWSKGNQGLHYPAVMAILVVPVCFYLFASTTKAPQKTMGNLFLGIILVLYVLSRII